METQADIRAKLEGVKDLIGIVRAMRTLAAGRVQQAEAELENIQQYAAMTQEAVDDVLAMAPRPGSIHSAAQATRTSIFVLGSEHGFVGALNRGVLTHVETDWGDETPDLRVVGTRCATVAAELGLSPLWSTPMASHGGGVERVARIVAAEVYAVYGRLGGGRVDLVYPRRERGGGRSIARAPLLPFVGSGYVADHAPPLRNLPASDLFAAVIAEHVFGQITLAVMETLAAANAARLATMQAAYDNLEIRQALLRARERQVRQQEITTELMDIVTGVEAQA